MPKFSPPTHKHIGITDKVKGPTNDRIVLNLSIDPYCVSYSLPVFICVTSAEEKREVIRKAMTTNLARDQISWKNPPLRG